ADENKDYGFYGANYTRWLDDRFTTLVGYRISTTFTRRANTSQTGTRPYTETLENNPSYNVGLSYQVKPWLYAYYGVGKTFDVAKGSNDPLGNSPLDTIGFRDRKSVV